MMMTKRQLIDIRWQTWNAWSVAFRTGVPCSRLVPTYHRHAPLNLGE